MLGKCDLLYQLILFYDFYILRALFDHDASKETGCPGEGISFKHGDILHVLNGSDDEWWQACPVGPLADDGPQGLIPSRQRIERRHKVGQKSVKFTRGEGEGDKANKVCDGVLAGEYYHVLFNVESTL